MSKDRQSPDYRAAILPLLNPEIINPATGRPYKSIEIAAQVGCSRSMVAKVRQLTGNQVWHAMKFNDLPPLPANARAYQLGVVLSGVQVADGGVGVRYSESHLSVVTDAVDLGKRKLTIAPFEPWGIVVNHPDNGPSAISKVHLPFEQFRHLLTPEQEVTRKFMTARARFVPFMLGLMLLRNTGDDRLGRLTIPKRYDQEILDRINDYFYRHMKYRLNYKDLPVTKQSGRSFISVRYPEMKIQRLMSEPSVVSLPFYEQIGGKPYPKLNEITDVEIENTVPPEVSGGGTSWLTRASGLTFESIYNDQTAGNLSGKSGWPFRKD